MPNQSRYTLLLDDGAVRSTERLRTAYGLKNKAEVYDLAVRVLSWVADQTANGYEVGRYTANGDFQPLLMTFDLDKTTWRQAATAIQ